MDTGNLIFGALIVVGCLALGLITGAIAQRKGRSYWGWSIGPLLISLGISLIFLLVVGRSNDMLTLVQATIAMLVYVYPAVWIAALISVLITGKTNKKMMQEIADEERMRAHIRERE